MTAVRSFFGATILCLSSHVAGAAVINLNTNLGGPTATGARTTGTGTFNGAFDTTASTLAVDVTFASLTSPTGGTTPPAHIHQASVPGGTGPGSFRSPDFHQV